MVIPLLVWGISDAVGVASSAKACARLTVKASVDRDPAGQEGFLYPRRIAVDGEGNIFMVDVREKTIAKYSPEGVLVAEFAGPGEGPGQLQIPTHVQTDADGNVVVYDAGNRRFTLFDNDGNLVRTVDFSRVSYNRVEEFRIGANGTYYVEIREPDFEGDRGGTAVRIHRLSEDLLSDETLMLGRVRDYMYRTDGSNFLTIPLPFNDEIYWDVAPNGNLVVAESGSYELTTLDPGLREINRFHHDRARVDVTDDDRERWLSSIGPDGREAVRESVEFPAVKPFFEGLRIDGANNVLVVTYDRVEKRYVCDVFAFDGTFAGEVELPSLIKRAEFANGFVYGWTPYDDPAGERLYKLLRQELEYRDLEGHAKSR